MLTPVCRADFRHTCEQNEGMLGYGWDEYDTRTGGRQVVHDSGNKIDLTTEFVKIPGGTNGGNWAVRIKGSPRDDASADLKTTVVFYAAIEGLGSLSVEGDDALGFEGDVTIEGKSPELGEFKIDITTGSKSNKYPIHAHPSHREKPLDRTRVDSLQLPDQALWQAKGRVLASQNQEVDKYVGKYGEENTPPPWQAFTIGHTPGVGNFHFVQKTFRGPFEFDVLFKSGSDPNPLNTEVLTDKIKSVTDSFRARFTRIFVPQAPFKDPVFEGFSRSLFSNLIGGIGYFYGDSKVDRSYAPEYEEENEGFWQETAEARSRGTEKLEGPSELFTSIPSRPFFPRGFLWDEGFHLLPVADWDIDLTLEITKSWFMLMDEDGWIGREQILGPEARSKVPAEFQTQYPHYANPPTLFFVLETFIDKLENANSSEKASERSLDEDIAGRNLRSAHLDNPGLAIQYLKQLYPLLKKHFAWFRRTQRGDIKTYDREAFSSKEAYRWRGRTPQHILTSGLDDYPRPQPPHPGELHVDLISWMGMMSRSMKRIAKKIGEDEDASEYGSIENAIIRNIDDLHWDERAQTYCDATIDAYEESVHVCHKGYVSIFPFMVGLVGPDSPRLKAVLDLIENPEELWSEYGIRSLSKKDELYGTEENYWRSPVWVNMNYLVIWRLLDLAQVAGPHQAQAQRMYQALRANVVRNVYDQWRATGFAWEQYNPEDGHGQRTQHFTGWTSLVVKLMAWPSLDGAQSSHDEL
ncbi:MAG: Processing alpha glucosidase I [Vezdaea acicularis]|nr:MAG: Processing alpha glucosidase I [Vezdaea acicularis]